MKKIILCSILCVFLLLGFSQGRVPVLEDPPAQVETNQTEPVEADSGTALQSTILDPVPDNGPTFLETHKATTDSEIQVENDPVSFSSAYPNPANKEVSIDYEMTDAETDVKFVIFNLLGKTVREVRISDPSGSLTLNTSDLNEGIYFYSMLIKNEPTRTQKLIIKH